MKKNIRLIIILTAAVAVLAVGLIFVLNIPQTEDENSVSKLGEDAILIYDKSDLDAEDISVSNSGGDYRLVGFRTNYGASSAVQESSGDESSENLRSDAEAKKSRGYLTYTMQEHGDSKLSKNMTDQLAHQCASLTALRTVDKSGKKLSEYGLDKPVSTVKIIFSDGSEKTIMMGNEAPDNQGYYGMTSDSNTVYLMQSETVNMFFVEKLQMFDKTISREYDSDNTDIVITSLSITGTSFKEPVEIDNRDDISIDAAYIMRKPNHEVCAKSMVQKVGESLYGITGNSVAAVDVNDDVKKEFGLEKPYLDISTKASDGTSVHILASKADEDGNCCVMKNGGSVICRVKSKDIEKWYGIKYEDLLAGAVIIPDIDNMTSMRISYNGQDELYDIVREAKQNELLEDVVYTEVKNDGKKISYNNFHVFVNNLASMTRKSMDVDKLDGFDKKASFELSYSKNDEKLTDRLAVYKNNSREYVLVLNDVIECRTDSDYAEKLLAQISKISGKEELENIETDTSDEQTSQEDSKKSE